MYRELLTFSRLSRASRLHRALYLAVSRLSRDGGHLTVGLYVLASHDIIPSTSELPPAPGCVSKFGHCLFATCRPSAYSLFVCLLSHACTRDRRSPGCFCRTRALVPSLPWHATNWDLAMDAVHGDTNRSRHTDRRDRPFGTTADSQDPQRVVPHRVAGGAAPTNATSLIAASSTRVAPVDNGDTPRHLLDAQS